MLPLGSSSAPGNPRASLVVAFALAALGLSVGGAAGCSVLLATDTNPHKCTTDLDCVDLPNAACDNAHRRCVVRLPPVRDDGGGGAPDGAGGGDDGSSGGGLTCELAFDNRTRILFDGPDGGLRPLPPETP